MSFFTFSFHCFLSIFLPLCLSCSLNPPSPSPYSFHSLHTRLHKSYQHNMHSYSQFKKMLLFGRYKIIAYSLHAIQSQTQIKYNNIGCVFLSLLLFCLQFYSFSVSVWFFFSSRRSSRSVFVSWRLCVLWILCARIFFAPTPCVWASAHVACLSPITKQYWERVFYWSLPSSDFFFISRITRHRRGFICTGSTYSFIRRSCYHILDKYWIILAFKNAY